MKKITISLIAFTFILLLSSCKKKCQTCTKPGDEVTLCADEYPNYDQFLLAISWQKYLGYTCTEK